MKKTNDIIKGFIDTLPLGISVSIYGFVYGILCGQAGLTVIEVLAMSMFVFAGASQIAAVQMILLGSNPFSIIATIFIVNLRHFLLAASISPYLKETSTKMKMVNSFFMTDESYAVTYSHFQNNKPTSGYFLGSGLNIYILWGGSGVIGYFLGSNMPTTLNYIFDFAFVAAFLSMLIPMIKDFPVVATVLVSGGISILGTKYIPGKWYIIIAGVGASFVGFLVNSLLEAKKNRGIVKEEVLENE